MIEADKGLSKKPFVVSHRITGYLWPVWWRIGQCWVRRNGHSTSDIVITKSEKFRARETGISSWPDDRQPKPGSFLRPRSWVLFNTLHANGTWLQNDVWEWNQNEFSRMKATIKDMEVENDLEERCTKDIQGYADLAKDSQYREDILIAATDHRGVFQYHEKNSTIMSSCSLNCNI